MVCSLAPIPSNELHPLPITGFLWTRGLQDQAELVLATMDKLAITHAYILGTSQGGFIAARCALLQPDRVSEGRLWRSFDLDFPRKDHSAGWLMDFVRSL